MGPVLLSHTSKKTDIKYSFRIIPIGGFVSMVGEDEDDKNDARALCKKPVWQRLLITFAGPFMNILLGIILTFTMTVSSQSIGNTTIASFTENSISKLYGLREGDEILKIGSRKVKTMNEVAYEIMRYGTNPLNIEVNRDNKILVLNNISFGENRENGIDYGVMDFKICAVSKTPSNIIRHTFNNSKLSIKMICDSLIDLITGKFSIDAVSGPVGITTTISDIAKKSPVNLIYLCSVISMNLGIFNLLPIPALDGGRIFFQIIELVLHKPVNRKLEHWIHTVGLLLLFAFMIFITFKDILKLAR